MQNTGGAAGHRQSSKVFPTARSHELREVKRDAPAALRVKGMEGARRALQHNRAVAAGAGLGTSQVPFGGADAQAGAGQRRHGPGPRISSITVPPWYLQKDTHGHELRQAQRVGPAGRTGRPGSQAWSRQPAAGRRRAGACLAALAAALLAAPAPRCGITTAHPARPEPHLSGSKLLNRASKEGGSSRYPACATACPASPLSSVPAPVRGRRAPGRAVAGARAGRWALWAVAASRGVGRAAGNSTAQHSTHATQAQAQAHRRGRCRNGGTRRKCS